MYYANYLRYFERARTEHFRERGVSVPELHAQGLVFAVTHVEVTYHRPAFYGDVITVTTFVKEVRQVRFTLGYEVRRKTTGELLATGETTLACVAAGTGKPRPLPEEWKKFLRVGV